MSGKSENNSWGAVLWCYEKLSNGCAVSLEVDKVIDFSSTIEVDKVIDFNSLGKTTLSVSLNVAVTSPILPEAMPVLPILPSVMTMPARSESREQITSEGGLCDCDL